MQFHHNGYVSENPRVHLADGVGVDRVAELPETMDVLIVGSGPAGALMGAQLSAFPEIKAVMIEKRPERLKLGHADGIQARTVETFQAFGFRHEIVDEAYRIMETSFWKPKADAPNEIERVAVTDDDPNGISEFEHIIVNQARVLDYFREFMEKSPSKMGINYGYEYLDLEIDYSHEYPVEATLRVTAGPDEGKEVKVRTKYLFGADGARSKVRTSIGATHQGVISYHAWGVVDMLADTNWPDIRMKSIIHSAAGSSLHIPREGGYLFRSYVDLGEVAEDDNHQVRNTPLDEIIDRLNKIVAPYYVKPKEVAWWSVYEVGHRVTDRFDEVVVPGTQDPHVFIAGDACHTHSAKAGQGMNVSMQDAFNLGWKLAQVLRGYSSPSLLATYTAERQQIAQDLIDFDLEWSGRMADARKSDESIEDFYVRTAEFPAGMATEYPGGSLLISGQAKQELAKGYPLGKRFKSARVVRRSDANPLHLGHLHEADGRWRIYAFADSAAPGTEGSKLEKFAAWLGNDPSSPVLRHTREGDDLNTVFDAKVIYQQPHREFEMTDVPEIFRPRVGKFQIENWNEVFGILQGEDIFDVREISRDGAVIIVRPDMYVAHIASLDDTESIAKFFEPIFDLS